MTPMQLEGHGSYWKAKILKIQEIQFFVAVIEKNVFFLTGITPRDPTYSIGMYVTPLFKAHNCTVYTIKTLLFRKKNTFLVPKKGPFGLKKTPT